MSTNDNPAHSNINAGLRPFDETTDHLLTRWQQADKPFLRGLFPLLAQGRPVSPHFFSQITGEDGAAVEAKLVEGRADRDPQGNVIGLFGVTLTPTLHRIQVGEVCLYSCCALVAQMIPLLLVQPAVVESVDPTSHRLVSVSISLDGIRSVKPKGATGTLVATTREQVLTDVGAAFCGHVCQFPDLKTAQEFADADPRRYVVGIQELHEAARQLTDAIWG